MTVAFTELRWVLITVLLIRIQFHKLREKYKKKEKRRHTRTMFDAA